MLICIFTGFASGLPLYLLLQLLPAWLQSEGINIKTIGLFGLTQIPYIWKFLWAPFLDRFSLFHLGRRRGWILLTQVMLLLLIASLGFFDPSINISLIACLSLCIAFFSATADITLDAYRRELLADNELAFGNTVHINAYRIAGLVPGSLSLILADHIAWQSVFIITSLFMLPSIILTFLIKEPSCEPKTPKSIYNIVVEPIQEFLKRRGLHSALLILAFIFFYKLGDSMATALATPFYLQMGFSKSAIGLIAKHAALWPSIFGAFLGGILMIKIGINKALWLFGVVQLVSILGFVWLSLLGPFPVITPFAKMALAIVIAFEALGVGLGTAAFVAFIAKNTNPLYTATQFALFTSLAALPRTIFNSTTGFLVESLGWTHFFWFCACLGIPGMLLLFVVAPWSKENS